VNEQSFTGVLLLSEVAEDSVLSEEERRRILEILLPVLRRKPAIVSISSPSVLGACELARYCSEHGAAGVLLSPLRHPGLGYRELYRLVDRVAEQGEIPTYLTLRSENALWCLLPEEQMTLGQHPKLRGVWIPENSPVLIRRWTKVLRKHEGVVLSGSALSFRKAASDGAHAVMCPLAILAVEQAEALVRSIERKEYRKSKRAEARLEPTVELLGSEFAVEDYDPLKRFLSRLGGRPLEGSAMVPLAKIPLLKAALKIQGHPVEGFVRPPFERASEADQAQVKNVLKRTGLLS